MRTHRLRSCAFALLALACRPAEAVKSSPGSPPEPAVQRDVVAPEPMTTTAAAVSGPPSIQCPYPAMILTDELRGFDGCSVSEAIPSLAGLCSAGDHHCLRPCRTDVYFASAPDKLANVIHYRYDALGRLLEQTIDHPYDMGADGEIDRRRVYVHRDDQLVRIEVYDVLVGTAVAARSTFERDAEGRIVDYEYADPRPLRRVRYARDAAGRITSTTVTTASTAAGFDGAVREVVTHYRYDERGRLSEYHNATYRWSVGYSGDGIHPVETRDGTVEGPVEPVVVYAWDHGRLQAEHHPRTGEGTSYEYDDAGRLVLERPIPPTDPARRIRRHHYDCGPSKATAGDAPSR